MMPTASQILYSFICMLQLVMEWIYGHSSDVKALAVALWFDGGITPQEIINLRREASFLRTDLYVMPTASQILYSFICMLLPFSFFHAAPFWYIKTNSRSETGRRLF